MSGRTLCVGGAPAVRKPVWEARGEFTCWLCFPWFRLSPWRNSPASAGKGRGSGTQALGWGIRAGFTAQSISSLGHPVPLTCMCVCFLGPLSLAHGPTGSPAGSAAAQSQTLHFSPGTPNRFAVSLLPCLLPFTGDILIYFYFYFFRALSQDDQDDIHLKLEDILQLVSSPVVLSGAITCKPPRQAACLW